MHNTAIFEELRAGIKAQTTRSAWSKGVSLYALELADRLEEWAEDGYFNPADLHAPSALVRAMLNGADDWKQYSWGGSSLIYDYDIAARLCTPSELRRTDGGRLRPNSREEWLDTQARALFQASRIVSRAAAALEF